MTLLRRWKIIIAVWCAINLQLVHADEVSNIRMFSPNGGTTVAWSALGNTWTAHVTKDTYFGEYIPLVNVSVATGDERLISLLPNCYFRGTLVNYSGNPIAGSNVFLNFCDNTIPFIGYVASGKNMYLIEKDAASGTGISMRLEETVTTIAGTDESNTRGNGWKDGGSGGELTPGNLYPRGNTPAKFPSVDIYVNPLYRVQVGEENYINRIMENFAASNTIYIQSAMRPLHLSAIILADQDISATDSQGNLLHGLEKIRKYTVLPDGADLSVVLTGGIFKQPYLWGWAEGGYGCDLEQAVAEGNNINTHDVGNSAAAIIDLPSLIQRAWILAHELGHELGMLHINNDPLADGTFQPELALKDYVAGCVARSDMYQSCAYDPQTKAFIDYYSCN